MCQSLLINIIEFKGTIYVCGWWKYGACVSQAKLHNIIRQFIYLGLHLISVEGQHFLEKGEGEWRLWIYILAEYYCLAFSQCNYFYLRYWKEKNIQIFNCQLFRYTFWCLCWYKQIGVWNCNANNHSTIIIRSSSS